ncbi:MULTISPECIES: MBL fold metallo-hydrolase [Burkholderia cepacia complex]|uniref:MBL fold metallo-hydrolase n=1 Tax=Burkholderia cepacia complex TaxID=87882 RepID=UPI001CF4C843|nr:MULTISPECIES: MBL fold metallo-hydrolase [Burkholderia cepacia complex]MCA8057397.1 MBL fold metallo-hydrolase [Burkholderia cepacia]MDN7535253.1 MBL fold metallo-hydrolase [Burkholderia orbicola]
MLIEGFFDPNTSSISYLLLDASTGDCALIDAVQDYDPSSGRTSTASADKLISRIEKLDAKVCWILETHVHADHLSAAPYLKEKLGGHIAIGADVTRVQDTFGQLFNAGSEFQRDGLQFDRLLHDGDTLAVGSLSVLAMHTPGHTPACMTYVVNNGAKTVAFVGDTLFMPDYGTARCDFPGGDARTLFHSINRVLSLPADTTLYMCHDYQPGGRELRFSTTVTEQREQNIHVRDGTSEDSFVTMRTARDATLNMPALMLPSVQINMRGGRMPPAEDNGISYIKIPLNAI